MHRLIVNPGTDNAWEIPLKHGTISLGRGEENDFPIDHPSISSAHCHISVSESGVIIKDLGSINGISINGNLVEETALIHGQRIQLGEVWMQFESAAPTLQSASAQTSVPVSGETVYRSAPTFCKFHPRSPASFICPKCQKALCESCVNPRRDEIFCRSCSVPCNPLEIVQSESAALSFMAQVRAAFAYPLRGDGVMLLVTGGIFFLLMDAAKFFAKYAFLYGFMAFGFLTVFGTGYLTAYLRRILTSSAMNENEMPDWPEFTDFGSDILSPFWQLIGTVLFCFAPAIALTIYAMHATEGGAWLGWATTASIFFGCLYFPMAFLAVAMMDSITAINPLLVIPSILKIPKEYALTIVLFIFILVIRWLGESILPKFISIPILPAVIANFLGLYLLTVEMRILGLLYWDKKSELGWFER